jgi:hypothetical protein
MVVAMFREWLERLDVMIAIVAGVVYGVMAQLVARLPALNALWWVMSFGYAFVLPVTLGSIAATSLRPQRGLAASIGAGLLTAALCLLIAFAVGWEGSICLVMMAPLYLILALVGALFGHRSRRRRYPAGTTLAIAALPLLSAGLEPAFTLPSETRVVHNQIDIRASQHSVWREIVRVRKIDEPQHSWFFSLGFPRPIEATLSHEGIGGVRHASFERGLVFFETIKEWQPERSFRFTIEVDPNHTPLTTLDAHVTVGGQFFDVLEGGYRIEPLDSERVRLHLDSQHRISTRFNFYTSLWSDALMSEIQRNILSIIKQRAEQENLVRRQRLVLANQSLASRAHPTAPRPARCR